jgi:hypothetical protein
LEEFYLNSRMFKNKFFPNILLLDLANVVNILKNHETHLLWTVFVLDIKQQKEEVVLGLQLFDDNAKRGTEMLEDV